jgi:hypothetical protein
VICGRLIHVIFFHFPPFFSDRPRGSILAIVGLVMWWWFFG